MSGTKRRYEQLQPQLQRDIVTSYQRGVRGHGLKAIAKAHQVPTATIQHVLARAEQMGGDPTAPRGHKKRKLEGGDEAKLWRTLDRNPFATNRDLAAAVGNKISQRRVSDYLARARPRFTAKVVQDQEPEELRTEWKTAARQWLEQVRRIPLDKRIYEDETPIYANEAPRKGRSRKGKPIFRARSRYAKKYTLHMYAKRNGVVHWDLADKDADTKEIERVATEAVEQMEGGETLIWDRLGRSGRASHPTSQHYSPEAKATFHARGVTTKFLPSKGKYFNPLELLFNDLKSHYIRPNFLRNGQALPKSRIEGLIREYVEEKAPTTLPGFFRARANGKHAVINEML